ncbi:hypothetical protein [Streptomyces katsurahamanus]|uniref:Uncharacterized protein n=1 Tax=Streptomyces katsurahamanus TaxID=2577098 RepID=A0ABW9NWK3_9ACTN|nr:hypothetical protein [Streptomyces katsurahamanus]MQS37710.1 hypothetical protein [Streptomyces katsurahamanus]
MRSTIAHDPYGHGSTAPRSRERDYREVTLPAVNAIVVYYVSAPPAGLFDVLVMMPPRAGTWELRTSPRRL